jgi:hypothetical protein
MTAPAPMISPIAPKASQFIFKSSLSQNNSIKTILPLVQNSMHKQHRLSLQNFRLLSNYRGADSES